MKNYRLYFGVLALGLVTALFFWDSNSASNMITSILLLIGVIIGVLTWVNVNYAQKPKEQATLNDSEHRKKYITPHLQKIHVKSQHYDKTQTALSGKVEKNKTTKAQKDQPKEPASTA